MNCSVVECQRPHFGRGLCNSHYQRLRRGAELSRPIQPFRYEPGTVCKVDGCDAQGTIQRGFCTTHYQRWRKWGDPHFVTDRSSRRGQPEAIPHGTSSGYTYHRCRCVECRQYKRRECAEGRLSDPDKASRKRHESYLRNRERALSNNRRWIDRNRDEFNRISSENYKRHQEATRASATNHHRPWLAEDDAVVVRTDWTTREIAQVLGRSIAAVRTRRSQLRKEHAA